MEDHSNDVLTSVMHLPDDCLIIIFQWLGSCSDRESFGLTCHRWYNIQNVSCHSLRFPSCFARLYYLHSDSYCLHRLLTRFQHLHHLSLSGCTRLPNSSLNPLQFYRSKLHSLHLDCCSGITDGGLSLVATGCSSLMVINLSKCNMTDVGLETLANGCSALKQISLSYCPLVSDFGLRALSQACHHLQTVKISCCKKINGIGLTGCSPTLAYLDADFCNLKPNGIVGIVSGGGLEYLNVSHISHCIPEDGLAVIGSGFATRLKILYLWNCKTVGDKSIMAIAKGCPLLQEWNLGSCDAVKISGWKSIGSNCNKLEKLHVDRCQNLCDDGLQALREGCKRLSVLYISKHCRQFSSTALEEFKLYRNNVDIREQKLTIQM